MTAVVLIAHGSRRPEANRDLDALAEAIGDQHDCVRTAYLELAEPTIPAAVADCLALGARRLILVPYFLSPGVHVQDDLENYARQFRAENPAIRFDLAAPLGRHPLLAKIVEERIRECLDGESAKISA